MVHRIPTNRIAEQHAQFIALRQQLGQAFAAEMENALRQRERKGQSKGKSLIHSA